MIKVIKKIILKLLKLLNLEISYSYLSFDDIYKKFLNDKVIIFDVGANDGRSILRFKKIFPDSEIHSFEPLKKQKITLEKLQHKYSNVYVNNFALGDKKRIEKLIVNIKDDTSSFLKIDLNSEWISKRSKEFNINKENFMIDQEDVQIETLDSYLEINNISNISVLKIDVQGFEEEVFLGGINSINN